MRLCIADPPYLGRAATWYGGGMRPTEMSKEYGGKSTKRGIRPADNHPDAALWDKPETHASLVAMLRRDFDGWAVAMAHDNLSHYMQWLPDDTRIGAWVKTQTMPGAARVINTWEPVAVWIPKGRRASAGQTIFPRDSLTAARLNNGFPGAKPHAWTRWVLDMMGYDADTDTVTDLFEGSGSVAREIAQQTLI